ncbi:MAG: UPF0182 family protein [Desulfobacterales bacterium]|jgi:uncharacterized membrane protein (UPF0182 family)|nr:UPF0182 family protein [Desulfobacterales bacterium]
MDHKDGRMGWVRRRLGTVVGVFFLLGALLLISSFFTIDFLVDYWWFDSLGYAFYFLQRLLYRYLVFLIVTALFFFIFFFNFWMASRYLGTGSTPAEESKPRTKTYRHVLEMFRTGSMLVYIPVSLILAIVIALPLFEHWEAFLLFVFGPQAAIPDPVYGKDISYYLFSFPIYSLLQRRIVISFAVLSAGVFFLYWLERRLLKAQEQGLPKGATFHVCFLVLCVFGIEIWDFFLQRYGLLYTAIYEPLFSGPGYAEMRVILPFLYASIFLLAVTAISAAYFVLTRKGIKVVIVSAVLFSLALGARYSGILPKAANDYWVNPNAISKQTPYLMNNIDATLSAYNLKRVEMRQVTPAVVPEGIDEKMVQGIFRNIPVWDGELLNDVYEQLQELRTYYDFDKVDVSHYNVRGNNQQVFLAVREMNTAELPKGARNWVNDHLVYTHGYGAVMTPAGQGGDEPMTWFLKGIPLESEFGFKIEQPAVYFGMLNNYPYVIVPNDAGEFGYPKGDANVTEAYEGSKGVFINSALRKLMFAYFLKDSDVFFTTKTNKKSRILFRRNIQERIRTITPYIVLDRDPYAVVTKSNLYWMQDGYTTSQFYPNSATHGSGANRLNYIRNSVKVVVNAYDGTVNYYIFDTQDPVINAYRRMYPGLFKDAGQMPPELRSQVRYPKDLFDIQMVIYAKYHQTDPAVFYQQEDIWEVGIPELGSEKQQATRSYYLTLDMIEPNRFDFVLVSPIMPKGRANLRAMALAGSDASSYGKLIIYSFPKGELVYGPAQINSLINQDTMVSQQLTLWDQVGSQVARGNMIIFPIGRMLIYIQPVYLKSSTTLKIPELKRLIMTQGQVVVMEKSLEEAFTKMIERVKAETGRIDRRFAPLSSEPEPSTPPPAVAPPVTPPAEAIQPGNITGVLKLPDHTVIGVGRAGSG